MEIYGAWVLILQLGAYVVYLDFGVQTAISKYIAEYEARGDLQGCSRAASAGLAIIATASIVGVLLTFGLAWAVPELFSKMPATLYRDVRISIVLVGISLSINLVASIFSAIFLGLQRYEVPMITNVVGRLAYAAAICLSVYFHSSLAIMGAAVAAANGFSALLQLASWKKLAPHIEVSWGVVDRRMLKQMLGYCIVLSIWSVCMLFVSGIDLVIVGHYDFSQTAFYSIATSPTTFVLMLIGAVLGPLLPASSALSAERTPEHMGDLLLRATRYGAVILLASGLPVLVGGYWLLHLWVGPTYAIHSVQYLRVLLVANILRNLLAPYATVVCGIGQTARVGGDGHFGSCRKSGKQHLFSESLGRDWSRHRHFVGIGRGCCHALCPHDALPSGPLRYRVRSFSCEGCCSQPLWHFRRYSFSGCGGCVLT